MPTLPPPTPWRNLAGAISTSSGPFSLHPPTHLQRLLLLARHLLLNLVRLLILLRLLTLLRLRAPLLRLRVVLRLQTQRQPLTQIPARAYRHLPLLHLSDLLRQQHVLPYLPPPA